MQPIKPTGPPNEHSGEKRKVIIELHPTRALIATTERSSYGRKPPFDIAALFPDIDIDSSFPPTRVPAEPDLRTPEQEGTQPQTSTPKSEPPAARVFNFIVRAEVDEDQLRRLRERPEVAGVFSDPPMVPFITCGYTSAKGTHLDVERLLCVPKLKAHGLDGSDVLVAIVDTGINLDYLNAHGKGPNFDRARSWAPSTSSFIPGQFPVHHGTMCAFDLCIAAPRCTVLDIAVIKNALNGLSGSLSDTIRAYEHLFDVMTAPRRLGERRSLVVSNSWGMANTSHDLPIGDPGNYSDNINHPICRSVAALEAAGADILFAAGNCGNDCPSGDCLGQVTKSIYGANSHPDVLCVAGVDITKARVGYSSQGPGRLENRKPDICGYTHFEGSQVYKVDNGTSAACPVVAGVVAAFRTRWQYDVDEPDTYPVALRHYVTSTAGHHMGLAYDYNRGRGVVRGCALVDAFYDDDTPPLRLPPSFLDEFCKQYPEQCPPRASGDQPAADTFPEDVLDMLRLVLGNVDLRSAISATDLEPILAAYLVGRVQREQHAPATPGRDCGCGQKTKER